MQDFLDPDEIMDWWLHNETVSLRYYLIGLLTFPESFLGILKGEDLGNYRSELRRLFGTAADNAEAEARAFLRRKSSVNIRDMFCDVLRELGLDGEALLGRPALPEYVCFQRRLQCELSDKERAVLAFLYCFVRNSIVHGTDFRVADVGVLSFRHRDIDYVADSHALMLSFHLLPAVLRVIHTKQTTHSQQRGV